MPLQRDKKKAGFTLTEVLVAMGLSSMLLASVLGSFVFLARSSLSIANYSEMNSQSRIGLEIFGRDVRNAANIKSNFSATDFTVLVPISSDDFEEITYTYLPNHPDRILVRKDDAGQRTVMEGVESLRFSYYDLQAEAATVPLQVKQIQLELTLVRQALSLQNTEKVVSARFILRNKEVAN